MKGLEEFNSSMIEESNRYITFKGGLKGVDCRYQVDMLTGEILTNDKVMYETIPYKHKDFMEIYNTPDTKRHWYDARDEEELIELCNYSHYDKGNFSIQRSDRIFDLVLNKTVGKSDFYIFTMLSNLIVRRNVAIIPKSVILDLLETDNKNITRAIKRVEKGGLLKFFKPSGRNSKTYTVVFHPALAWRGDYSLRWAMEKSCLSIAGKGYWWEARKLSSEFE